MSVDKEAWVAQLADVEGQETALKSARQVLMQIQEIMSQAYQDSLSAQSEDISQLLKVKINPGLWMLLFNLEKSSKKVNRILRGQRYLYSWTPNPSRLDVAIKVHALEDIEDKASKALKLLDQVQADLKAGKLEYLVKMVNTVARPGIADLISKAKSERARYPAVVKGQCEAWELPAKVAAMSIELSSDFQRIQEVWRLVNPNPHMPAGMELPGGQLKLFRSVKIYTEDEIERLDFFITKDPGRSKPDFIWWAP